MGAADTAGSQGPGGPGHDLELEMLRLGVSDTGGHWVTATGSV